MGKKIISASLVILVAVSTVVVYFREPILKYAKENYKLIQKKATKLAKKYKK